MTAKQVSPAEFTGAPKEESPVNQTGLVEVGVRKEVKCLNHSALLWYLPSPGMFRLMAGEWFPTHSYQMVPTRLRWILQGSQAKPKKGAGSSPLSSTGNCMLYPYDVVNGN